MERYTIRALKATLYFLILMSLIFALVYFMQGGDKISLTVLAQQAGLYRLLIIGLAFGLSYPFIGFGKKNVYLNKTFSQEKSAIIDIFGQYGYELSFETETSLFFRPTNRLKRLFDQYEDTIEVVHKDNPIIIKGIRKRIVRITLTLENYILSESK
jgi:hypothetical protein